MNLGSRSEGSLKERFRETARLAILDAAEAAFAAHGLEGARVDDIAAAARVSVGTLYNYFGDRQQLLEALLDSRRQEVLSRLDDVLAEGESAPFASLLENFVRALFSHFDAHRPLFQLLLEQEASQLRSRTRGKSVVHDLVGRAERLVRLGVGQGVLRTDDSDHFPVFLIGTIRAVTARAKSERRRKPLKQLAPVAVRFFLSGAEK